MKQILLKTLYSIIVSFFIFNSITLVGGYFMPLQTLVLVGFMHLLVIFIGLLELKSVSNKKFKIIPHLILVVLFFFWAWLSPDSSDGNDFYLAPLSAGISQLLIAGIETKKQVLTKPKLH